MVEEKEKRNGWGVQVMKPDIDNLIKTVLDACNGHVWKDDNQITEITSSKRYGIESESYE